ncbi:sn-glycerol-3-phosphate ABC transporter ATP-binding protein UgpC [Desemzia sp. RIT804]|uniref:ABC transporter ATP-binding protein n=1 Tax=Desemzia sp. RIT 804 TaxID=2810209 RepID=UPI0019506400|nr:sn-glycerol-3-phosphate ABC transporter ATP-binding protein UgpC [Desemzia sp. RIT 804]MBM6615925.1 sn-glycerol-3-phosphate ABC transporter ATP-binding protein UgpC [Desemzia sp. RIT 804]
MSTVSLQKIKKVYDKDVVAVKEIDLEIKDKEFLVFVGPSGCGKSTTLRMIAGLEEISGGRLYIGEDIVNYVESKDRDIAMVFQNYALYPHMTIFDNMAFPLKMQKMAKNDIKQRVEKAAKILQLEDYLKRKPAALSGGQRQRVALGRAIVRNPKVFLLDEPLSNLDAKLRVAMRSEIVKLHRQLGTTFVYVTHDQTEAMTMGDRIVVMNAGKIEQVDTPENLYNYPKTKFVAEFIGSPQMNILKTKLVATEEGLAVMIQQKPVLLGKAIEKKINRDSVGKEIYFGIRPETFTIETASKNNTIDVYVDNIERMGSDTHVFFEVEGAEKELVARIEPYYQVSYGDAIRLSLNMNEVYLFDAETELTLIQKESIIETTMVY